MGIRYRGDDIDAPSRGLLPLPTTGYIYYNMRIPPVYATFDDYHPDDYRADSVSRGTGRKPETNRNGGFIAEGKQRQKPASMEPRVKRR